jgi:hypothetical protein
MPEATAHQQVQAEPTYPNAMIGFQDLYIRALLSIEMLRTSRVIRSLIVLRNIFTNTVNSASGSSTRACRRYVRKESRS